MMSKLMTVSSYSRLNLLFAMLLPAALFGCHVLASTFQVLTWRIMPDAGED
jgi:hypothetical protein